jgi:hypothetical protein
MHEKKKLLTRKGLRLVTSLFHQKIECKRCGASWRLEESVEKQNWLCPNGCNAKKVNPG